jgi:hypothetical protein
VERFSEKTLKYLTTCGWYPGRQIDIRKVEESLAANGLRIFPAAQEFWREFGNLYYQWDDQNGYSYLDCDLEYISEDTPEHISKWAFKAGTDLLPIGEIESGMETAYITPEGSIYTIGPGRDGRGSLIYWIDSADEFINNLPESNSAPWKWRPHLLVRLAMAPIGFLLVGVANMLFGLANLGDEIKERLAALGALIRRD